MLTKSQSKNIAEMCDEIQLWLSKVIKGWGEVLEQKYHNEVSQTIQKKFELLVDTTKELKTFYQVLKERSGDLEMIESVYHIMNCCLVREYTQATSRYIDLSIGNAPWPMGVAMLGITVRKNA